MHALDAGLLVNAASGLVLIAFGLLVALVRRTNQSNWAFALFAIPFGAVWLWENLWGPSGGHVSVGPDVVVSTLLIVASVGLVYIAAVVPRPLERADNRAAAEALVVALGVFVAYTWYQLWTWPDGVAMTASRVLIVVAFDVFHGVAWGALVLFARRHAATLQKGPDGREAQGLRLMALALVLYPAFFLGRNTLILVKESAADPAVALWGLLLVVAVPVVVAAYWLVEAQQGTGRLVAWFALGATLIGIPGFGLENNHPGFGIARTVGVLVLGYAIIRHQLLGIDVKLRWTISKSTVAAAFIAVFFVASEAATEFFGETFRSGYVGIAAAGMLVFAIAPLQRVAERVAVRAVPVQAEAAGAPSTGDPAVLYRTAVRHALVDGRSTRAEERYLAELADRLGIGAGRALTIREEVEGEPTTDAAPL